MLTRVLKRRDEEGIRWARKEGSSECMTPISCDYSSIPGSVADELAEGDDDFVHTMPLRAIVLPVVADHRSFIDRLKMAATEDEHVVQTAFGRS